MHLLFHQKVLNFTAEDCEEPLIFDLNEEDEEEDPSPSDSGKYVKIPFNASVLFFMTRL